MDGQDVQALHNIVINRDNVKDQDLIYAYDPHELLGRDTVHRQAAAIAKWSLGRDARTYRPMGLWVVFPRYCGWCFPDTRY